MLRSDSDSSDVAALRKVEEYVGRHGMDVALDRFTTQRQVESLVATIRRIDDARRVSRA